MPCTDGGYTREQLDWMEYVRNTTTRLACDRCKEFEERGEPIPEWAAAWWMKHKEFDRQRREREENERQEKLRRLQAVSKLTAEERELLKIQLP